MCVGAFVVPSIDLDTITATNKIGSALTMPDPSTDDQALAVEFDVLAARAGFPVIDGRKPALLQGYKDLKRMTALMRQPRTAANEPAGAYSILSVTRSI
jgi:hypothetical protein